MNEINEIIVIDNNFNTNDINAITTNTNNINNTLTTYTNVNILSDNPYYRYTGYELIQMFLEDKETDKTNNTRESYEVTLTQFFNNIMKVGMNDKEITVNLIKSINRSHAQAFRRKLDGKIKSDLLRESSANLKLSHMEAFCEWIRKITGLITTNPFFKMTTFSVDNNKVGSNTLTKEETNAILNECDNQKNIAIKEDNEVNKLKWVRNKLMIELSMSLVIRREALVNLTLDDFVLNIEGEYLCTKFDKTQTNNATINKKLYNRLVEFYEQDKNNRKYDNRYKGCIFGICSDQFNRIIKDLAKKVGINKKITCHSLKSTMGYIGAEEGLNLSEITEMMHHDDPVTSQIYYRKGVKNGTNTGSKVFNLIVESGNINKDNVNYDKVSDMSDLISGELNSDEIKELIRVMQDKVRNNNCNKNVISKAM